MIRIWTMKRNILANVHTLRHALFFSWIQRIQWVVVVYDTTAPLWYFNFASMAILYHAKRYIWAKCLPLLQFETNSGTTTHSVEKKIILHDILHSSHVTILSCEKNSTSFTKHGSLQIAAKNGLLTNNSLLCMSLQMMRLQPKS